MTAAQFDRFITLVEMDQRAQHLSSQCQVLDKEKSIVQEQLNILERTLEFAHAQAKVAHKAADALELELTATDTQLREKQLKLARAATPREYFSLEQELITLEAQRAHYEDELFKLWQVRDQAQEQYSKLLQELPKKQEHIHQQLTLIQEQTGIFTHELEKYREHRASYLRDIDPVLLEHYQQMLQRVSNPVVPVAHESCTSCFYPVSKLDLATLKQHELVTCKGCYRLLYIPNSSYEGN